MGAKGSENMELTVAERLMILNLLPNEGNFTNLKLLRVARENLSFSDAENKALNFQQTGDQVTWTNSDRGNKGVELGRVVETILADALKKLDDESKLKDEQISLYEKFVEVG